MREGCNYITPDGQTTCGRQKVVGNLCVFHLELDNFKKSTALTFYEELKHLAEKNDTNWAGFIFPAGFKMYDLEFHSAVDLKWSIFEDIIINNIQSDEKFEMRHSIINGKFHLSKANFSKDANFHGSSFKKDVDINAKFCGEAGFHGCDFYGRTSFLGSFSGSGTFHMSRFHEAATFRGGRDISISPVTGTLNIVEGNDSVFGGNDKQSIFTRITKYTIKVMNYVKKIFKEFYLKLRNVGSLLYRIVRDWMKNQKRRLLPMKDSSVKIRWLFDSEIQMTEVEFRRPGSTKFIGVDMSKVSLVGTDMKGVHFYDVKFYQPSLKRQGLYDEVSVLQTGDYNLRCYMWPRIESEYRNLRVALESNKDYSTATDFYVGEMESRRRQMLLPRRYLLSVEALYHSLSKYGSSPLLAIRIFVLLVMMHAVLTMMYVIKPPEAIYSILNLTSMFPVIEYPIQTISIYIINSFKVLTLQRGDGVLESTSFYSHIIDTIFRVLGPIQLTLIALAIRVKIKRH